MKTAIVIGGGIAGCSTAYALAKRNIVVTLVERHQSLAEEASGNPVAMLYHKFSSKRSTQSMVQLAGFEFTLNLLKSLPNTDTLHQACGLIQLAFNNREQAKQAALLSNDEIESMHYEPVSAEKASTLAGIELKHNGLYLPNAGWVKPKAFCAALTASDKIKKALSNEAISIKKTPFKWQVQLTNSDTLNADIVVICTANDIKQFVQCGNPPIVAVRGQLNFFPQNAQSSNIKMAICSNHYLSPSIDGLHTIGTSFQPNDMNAKICEKDTLNNLHALKAISPSLYAAINPSETTARVAWRSATRDYLPLAGQLLDETAFKKNQFRYNASSEDLPWLEGLYVNAGHGSKGMITAPLCGDLIGCLAANETPNIDATLASRLNIGRFALRDAGLKQLAQSLY